jgi:hypothetical protein
MKRSNCIESAPPFYAGLWLSCDDAGFDLHSHDDGALRAAVVRNDIERVKVLIKAGANVRVRDDTPLRWATVHNNVDMVKALLDAGANACARNNAAFCYAVARSRNVAMARVLLDAGADVNARGVGSGITLLEDMVDIYPAADPKFRARKRSRKAAKRDNTPTRGTDDKPSGDDVKVVKTDDDVKVVKTDDDVKVVKTDDDVKVKAE